MIAKDNVKKILFITLSNIGDAILTLPAFDILCRRFPSAKFTVITGPKCEELFKCDPSVEKVIVYDKKGSLVDKLKMALKLRREGFDAVADMRHTIFPLLIGVRPLTRLIRKKNDSIHAVIDHILKLGRFPKEADPGSCFRLYVPEYAESFREKLWKEAGIKEGEIVIGINPHAASSLKMWSASKYIDLMNSLQKERRAKFVLVGGAYAKDTVHEIVKQCPWIIDIVGRTNLPELGAVIKKLDLLITCDSGPMHFASALGVPAVAIFGPTDPKRYGPFGNRHVVVRKELACSPCGKAQCENGTRECMEAVTVDDVYAAARKLLSH